MKWFLVATFMVMNCFAINISPADAGATRVCTKTRVVRATMGGTYSFVKVRCVWKTNDRDPAGQGSNGSPVACTAQTVAVTEAANGRKIALKMCGAPGAHGSAGGPAHVNWSVAMLRAFRATVIPKSKLVIQPPGGKTLINFETLYRTNAKAFTRSFRLLGQRVQLRITPASYTWVTGSGEKFSTTDPGVAYDESRPMSDYVSYNYEHPAEELHPRVDVTWTAQFRVGHGKWRRVQGSVTTTGPEADLKVIEARTVLLGGYGG